MAQHSDKNKKSEPIKKHPLTREVFYATPIYFKDLENSKELNAHLLKHIKKWKKKMKKV